MKNEEINIRDPFVVYENGKYYLWRGDLNKYVEVDISDLD